MHLVICSISYNSESTNVLSTFLALRLLSGSLFPAFLSFNYLGLYTFCWSFNMNLTFLSGSVYQWVGLLFSYISCCQSSLTLVRFLILEGFHIKLFRLYLYIVHGNLISFMTSKREQNMFSPWQSCTWRDGKPDWWTWTEHQRFERWNGSRWCSIAFSIFETKRGCEANRWF